MKQGPKIIYNSLSLITINSTFNSESVVYPHSSIGINQDKGIRSWGTVEITLLTIYKVDKRLPNFRSNDVTQSQVLKTLCILIIA